MPTPLLLYLFNEASSGTTPTLIDDTSTGTPANATITYGASGAWANIGAGDGLNYAATASAVTAALTGTKVQTAISGSLVATVELVVDSTLSASSYDEYFSLHDNSGNVIVDVTINQVQGGLIFGVANAAGVIKYAVPLSGVYVLHVVVDTSQATAANRILVYVNGTPVTPSIIFQVPQNTAIDTGVNWANTVQSLGGFLGAQFPNGLIYYAALYATALTSGQVATNAAALASNNDADPNNAVSTNPVFFGGMGVGP